MAERKDKEQIKEDLEKIISENPYNSGIAKAELRRLNRDSSQNYSLQEVSNPIGVGTSIAQPISGNYTLQEVSNPIGVGTSIAQPISGGVLGNEEVQKFGKSAGLGKTNESDEVKESIQLPNLSTMLKDLRSKMEEEKEKDDGLSRIANFYAEEDEDEN